MTGAGEGVGHATATEARGDGGGCTRRRGAVMGTDGDIAQQAASGSARLLCKQAHALGRMCGCLS